MVRRERGRRGVEAEVNAVGVSGKKKHCVAMNNRRTEKKQSNIACPDYVQGEQTVLLFAGIFMSLLDTTNMFRQFRRSFSHPQVIVAIVFVAEAEAVLVQASIVQGPSTRMHKYNEVHDLASYASCLPVSILRRSDSTFA